MITKMDEKTMLIKLGDGTLYSGVAYAQEKPVGIVFTNNQDNLDEAVIFQITSIEGVAGYLLPLLNLFDKWNGGDDKRLTEEINAILDLLEPFKPIENKTTIKQKDDMNND